MTTTSKDRAASCRICSSRTLDSNSVGLGGIMPEVCSVSPSTPDGCSTPASGSCEVSNVLSPATLS